MRRPQTRPIYLRRRLNPDRATVWFVGKDDDGNIEKIELEAQAHGLPYMIPSWWTGVYGPYTKDDADAVYARLKDPTPAPKFVASSSRALECQCEHVSHFDRPGGGSWTGIGADHAYGADAPRGALAHARTVHGVFNICLACMGRRHMGSRRLDQTAGPARGRQRAIDAGVIFRPAPAPRPEFIEGPGEYGHLHEEGPTREPVWIRYIPATQYAISRLHRGMELRYGDTYCQSPTHRNVICWKRIRVTGEPRSYMRDIHAVRVPVKFGLRHTFRLTYPDFSSHRVGLVGELR